MVSFPDSLLLFKPLLLTHHLPFRSGASGLAWNDTLASYALDWAKRCAFHHSGGPSGENLAASYGRPDPIGDGIAGWEKEASLYDWDHPGYKNTTGHFTQMVWKGTMSLGCAKVECGANTVFPSESYPQQDFVVSPPETAPQSNVADRSHCLVIRSVNTTLVGTSSTKVLSAITSASFKIEAMSQAPMV